MDALTLSLDLAAKCFKNESTVESLINDVIGVISDIAVDGVGFGNFHIRVCGNVYQWDKSRLRIAPHPSGEKGKFINLYFTENGMEIEVARQPIYAFIKNKKGIGEEKNLQLTATLTITIHSAIDKFQSKRVIENIIHAIYRVMNLGWGICAYSTETVTDEKE